MSTKSWLWPNRVIGKRESRVLREEHNKLVNEHLECIRALMVISEPEQGDLPPHKLAARVLANLSTEGD